jgi:hypothetical protein
MQSGLILIRYILIQPSFPALEACDSFVNIPAERSLIFLFLTLVLTLSRKNELHSIIPRMRVHVSTLWRNMIIHTGLIVICVLKLFLCSHYVVQSHIHSTRV